MLCIGVLVFITVALGVGGAQGGSFPAVFELSSLDGTSGFRMDGIAGEEYSGWSVAGGGDFNGDGIDDVLIGAAWAVPNALFGRTYVVFGNTAPFRSHFSLSQLNGLNGFRLEGAANYDQSGWRVAPAGDFNDDGIADVLIGAPFADLQGELSGSAYVVFGTKRILPPIIELSELTRTLGVRLDGEHGTRSGNSVAGVGDMNGDGISDVASGAPYAGDTRGASYIVFGSSSRMRKRIRLPSVNGFKVKAGRHNAMLGRSIAAAGDVNGDGLDDMIVGAPQADRVFGMSYVVFGSAAGFPSELDPDTLDGTNGFRVTGGAREMNGYHVAGAGDINSDGFDDLLVAGSNSESSYVVFGSANPPPSFDLDDLDGANGFRLKGTEKATIAAAGDVNGDGLDDLVVGDPHNNARRVGTCYVVYGKTGGYPAVFHLSTLDGTNGFRIVGESRGDEVGYSVGAGDINGDGTSDLVIGAAGANDYAGSTYVVFGRP